jgi:transposase-like protein
MAEENGRRQAVALALASGKTVRAAAKACQVGETTVYTWLREPSFRLLVSETRGELFDQAVGALVKLANAAAAGLGKLLKSKNENIKLGACRSVLENSMRARDLAEFEQRLLSVERWKAEREQAKEEGTP